MAAPSDNKPEYILVHCSAYPAAPGTDRLGTIDALHKQRGFDRSSLGYYVGYHVLITGGVAHRTRVDSEHGDHCNNLNFVGQPGYLFPDHNSLNFHSVAVCVDFNGDDGPVPAFAIPLLKAQIQEWMQKYNIPLERVRFHRDFDSMKSCPGNTITHEWLAALLAPPAPVPTPAPPTQDTVETLQKRISLLEALVQVYQQLLALMQKRQLGATPMNEYPAWYQSTNGPGLSATVMNLAGTFLPVINLLLASKGVHIMPADIEPYVDAVIFLAFSVMALIGYVRSKLVLQAKVKTLSAQVKTLGAAPHASL